MTPHYQDATVTVYAGDCLDILRELPDASVDSVVTDPPYGLEFMGKEWDAPWKSADSSVHAAARTKRAAEVTPTGQAHSTSAGPYLAAGVNKFAAGKPFQDWCELWATECLRVLKPGGHLLAFGGTRTSHRLASAIEDAGFEIRDSIAWLYGSGFPKSLDVSKAMDEGIWRGRSTGVASANGSMAGPNYERTDKGVPATDAARQWAGWGTALKPAHEPIVVARKPLTGTVAHNVLTHGTGALNIAGCRIGSPEDKRAAGSRTYQRFDTGSAGKAVQPAPHDGLGRWPANVVLDESQAAVLDEQSGTLTSGANPAIRGGDTDRREVYGGFTGGRNEQPRRDTDSGGAARFFYTAKADAAERVRVDGVAHPTVKPLSLMRWLVRLVTPPGGTILEPFAGSGTTVEACLLEGFKCVAIEREPDYLPLITQRIHRRRDPVQAVRATSDDGGLFDLLDGEPA